MHLRRKACQAASRPIVYQAPIRDILLLLIGTPVPSLMQTQELTASDPLSTSPRSRLLSVAEEPGDRCSTKYLVPSTLSVPQTECARMLSSAGPWPTRTHTIAWRRGCVEPQLCPLCHLPSTFGCIWICRPPLSSAGHAPKKQNHAPELAPQGDASTKS